MQSNAVSQSDVSAVVGYLLAKGYFNTNSPNLPQNISILAEANTANQSSLSTLPQVVTSAAQVGGIAGYGSPAHGIARILFPASGTGVNCPVTLYLQAAAVASVAKVITITPTGTATANGTIYMNVCGRKTLDGVSYAVNIVTGDTPTVICGKMRAATAAVLGCPLIGTGTSTAIYTAKWTGLTSDDANIAIDTNGTSTGVTFAVVSTTSGSGTPATGGAANGTTYFGNKWNTIIINSYGLVSATITELETYNGIPDPVAPTGQYSGVIWRPGWYLSGTLLDDPTSITNVTARKTQVTIVPCVAPLSAGFGYEAAANVARIIANVFNDNPEQDVIGMTYPDMPPPALGVLPQMTGHIFRQYCVTRGCSTVDYSGNYGDYGVYSIVDLVTTYNPDGENPPFYRWVRDLNVWSNYKFGYYLLQQINVAGKTIVPNNSTANTGTTIKPGGWAAEVAVYNLNCEKRALLVNVKANNKTIDVSIGGTNPARLDTVQNAQISSAFRIGATTTFGGFFFGS